MNLGVAEIYNNEDVRQAQELVQVGLERSAINNVIIRKIQGKKTEK